MLKITRGSRKGRGLTIKLEGEILGPWLGTVRDASAIPGLGPGDWTWPPLPMWTPRVFNCFVTWLVRASRLPLVRSSSPSCYTRKVYGHSRAPRQPTTVPEATRTVAPHFSTAIHRAAAHAVRISEKRCIMSKVWFSVVLGTVALLGLPGMSFAQHMRGRTHGSVQGNMRGGGFHRGFDQRFFDPRFHSPFFDPRFSAPFFDPRFGGF